MNASGLYARSFCDKNRLYRQTRRRPKISRSPYLPFSKAFSFGQTLFQASKPDFRRQTAENELKIILFINQNCGWKGNWFWIWIFECTFPKYISKMLFRIYKTSKCIWNALNVLNSNLNCSGKEIPEKISQEPHQTKPVKFIAWTPYFGVQGRVWSYFSGLRYSLTFLWEPWRGSSKARHPIGTLRSRYHRVAGTHRNAFDEIGKRA